jgi:hypothetical protein
MSKKKKPVVGVKCTVCGKVCKSAVGLASHMRVHKNDQKKAIQGAAELVRVLTGSSGGLAGNQDLMDQAKEVDVLMETFPPIQSKRSVERLEKLCEVRDQLDAKIHANIVEKINAAYTKPDDLIKWAQYLTAQIESEQTSIKTFQTVAKGGVDFNLTAILNQIMSVNSMSGGADMGEFGDMTPGQREQIRRYLEKVVSEKVVSEEFVDVDATSAS